VDGREGDAQGDEHVIAKDLTVADPASRRARTSVASMALGARVTWRAQRA
jgi:hypothetical protein